MNIAESYNRSFNKLISFVGQCWANLPAVYPLVVTEDGEASSKAALFCYLFFAPLPHFMEGGLSIILTSSNLEV